MKRLEAMAPARLGSEDYLCTVHTAPIHVGLVRFLQWDLTFY